MTRRSTGGQVEIAVLGPLEVRSEGRPLRLTGAVDRRMLASLAATPGTPIAVTTLTELVYGHDADPPSVRHSMYRLRKLLGPEAIASTRGSYVLDVERCAVDITAFELGCRNGRQALAEGKPETAIRWLKPALALWRGDPLTDVAEHRDVTPIVRRLSELRVAMQVELGAAFATANRLADAISTFESVVAEHPLRERAWAHFMSALDLDGRPDDALAAFDRARLALAESGLEPGVQLREAVERIGGRAEGPAPVLHRSPDRLNPLIPLIRSGPLAGRTEEIRSIEESVATALDQDSAQVVVISGEPGVGKTRLAAEVAHQAHDGGLPVWFETPAPYLSLPFGPFVGLVQQMIAGVDLTERGRLLGGPLARLVSDGAIPPHETEHPDVQRFQLFEAVAGLVASVTQGRGGLVVLDDLHDSHPATWQMLHHVIASRPSTRLCVIVTMRDPGSDDAIAAEVARLRHLPSTSSHKLGGLSPHELADLLGGSSLGPEAAQQVHELTGGNPLYALGLARMPSAVAGISAVREGTSVLEDAIDSHLGTLSATCRALLRTASVAGRTFSRRWLSSVAADHPDLDPADVPSAMKDAVKAGIVLADETEPDRLSFTHDLLREALYRDLGRQQSSLHLMTGRVIERLAAGDGRKAPPGELAHHFALAWPDCAARVAAQYLIEAGRAADRRFEFASGDEHYTRALRVLAQEGNPADDDVRADLFILAGQSRLANEDVDRARSALSAAAELGRDRGWPDVLSIAAVNYADSWGATAPDAYGAELLRAATALETSNATVRADVLYMLHRVDPAAATSASWSLVERCSDGDAAGAAAMLDNLWFTEIGHAQARVADEMLRVGDALGDHDLVGLGQLRSWMTGVMLGERRLDDKVIQGLRRDVQRSADDDLRWMTLVWLGAAATARGDIETSLQLAEEARRIPVNDLHSARGLWRNPARVASTYHTMRALNFGARGDVSDFMVSINSIGKSGFWRGADYRFGLVRLIAELGQVARTVELIDAILREPLERAHPDAEWIAGLAALAWSAVAVDHTEAIETVAAALTPFAGSHTIVSQHLYFGMVEHYLGLLAGAAGDLDAAVDYFGAARDGHRAVAADMWVMYSTTQLAIHAWRRNDEGDRAWAETLHAESSALADRMGRPMPPHEWPPEV